MTDKEQIIIDGKKQYCKILFRCKHIDDTAAYDMMCEGIEIKPENAPVSDFELMLIENANSPFGFSLVCKRNNKEDVWEHSGFGNSGACSIVTALLKQLTCKTQECEAAEYDYQKQLENTNKWIAECENLQQQLDQLRGENAELKKQLIQKDEVNTFFNTSIKVGIMTDKEQVIDVSNCMYLDGNYCPNHDTKCDFVDNCYFREYKRKEQECEELKEKYEVLRLENEEGYEIFAELKHECKKQEDKIKKLRKNLALEIESTDRYRNALEEIEEYTKNFKELDLFEDIKDIINKAKGRNNE